MKYLHFAAIAIFFCAAIAQADQASSDDKSDNNKVEKSTDTPKIIERELTPDTGEYARTPCYKTERYCTEWLSDGKCKLWDSRQVQVAC